MVSGQTFQNIMKTYSLGLRAVSKGLSTAWNCDLELWFPQRRDGKCTACEGQWNQFLYPSAGDSGEPVAAYLNCRL